MQRTKIKLVAELKQHTPLIHFQVDQAGATLRATEVKPKLDHFLLNLEGADQYETRLKNAKDNGWLVGQGAHPALDYQLRIVDLSAKEERKDKRKIKLITENDKNSIFSSGKIELSVLCFHEGLLDLIWQHLEAFFVLHNFGTRQKKGWGCFYLVETTKERFTKLLTQTKRAFKRWTVAENNWIRQVDVDHRRMKSGVNHSSFAGAVGNQKGYEKSKLRNYFQNHGINWDKAKFKQEILASPRFDFKLRRNRQNPHDIQQGTNFKYVRALLGLAEHYEFQTEGHYMPKYKLKVNGGDIQRFKSPLTFKVFQGDRYTNIYLLVEEIPDAMFEHVFNFKLGTRSMQAGGEADDDNFEDLLTLKTPKKSEIDLIDFVRTCGLPYNYLQ